MFLLSSKMPQKLYYKINDEEHYIIIRLPTKDEFQDEWWCRECEYGPMEEKDNKCHRSGAKNNQYFKDEVDGWEDPDIDKEVEEIDYGY